LSREHNELDSPEIIPAKLDFVFKRIFGKKRNIRCLIGFLKAIIDLPDEDYKTLAFGDTTLNPRRKDGKRFVLDIKLETASGKTVEIEIQLADTSEMRERIVAYESRLISDQLDQGDDYRALEKTISILITDFPLLRESEKYHHNFMVRSEDGDIILTDTFEIHTLELKKLPVAEDGTKLWRWLRFLAATKSEELEMLQQYPELEEPIVILKELSADEAVREDLRAYRKVMRDEASRIWHARKEGEAKGLAKGLAEGKAKGLAKGKAEGLALVAKNLLQEGMPVDRIAKLTGLSPEEIAAMAH
jgi:predicted transposase/invertase (TIGR01784 family)